MVGRRARPAATKEDIMPGNFKFSYKVVEMLIGARALCDIFGENREPLVAARSTWVDPFIDNYRTCIDTAMEQYLGHDFRKRLRDVSLEVRTIMGLVLPKLALFKSQIEYDYSGAALKNLLDSLGYSRFYKSVQNKNQEATIQMLYQFRQNMTDELKAELVAKGMAADLIDGIISQIDALKEADTLQESLKASGSGFPREAVDEFNAIYKEAIGICKIARQVFRANPEKRALFTFSRLVKRMSA